MTSRIDPLSIKPPSTRTLVWGTCSAVILSIAVASQLEYSKKEYVSGYIQPAGGELRVVAPSRGIVTFKAGPGGAVVEGQVMAVIRKSETLGDGRPLLASQQSSLGGRVASVQTELLGSVAALESRAAALTAQLQMVKASVTQAENEAETRRQYVLLEERKSARQTELRRQGFIAQPAVEQSAADLLARKAEVQTAERAVTQARVQVAATEADLASTQAQLVGQRGALQRELKGLEQQVAEVQSQGEVHLVAPKAGNIAAMAVASGDAVDTGQLLAKLTPSANQLEALLLLPPTAAARVKPGQMVKLQMAAYPYQTFGLATAQVLRVEQLPLLADETALRGNGVAAGSLVLKATAKLVDAPEKMGGLPALKTGMQYQAAIEVERKSFLAWMIWPLMKHFL